MKKIIIYSCVIVASIALTAGIVQAATRNITATLGGASGDLFDLDGALQVDSMRVGNQGTGGVTYFNGTIINTTTNSGADNPVTFGDNVRIDGRVYRGATAGTSDTLPFIVNDNMEVTGSLAVGSLSGTGIVTSTNITDGTIATADLADGAVTSGKIADGTVSGSDIATTADLSVDAIAATGNITQSNDKEGAVKGWAYVASGGTLTAGYNVDTVAKTSTGRYTVKFTFVVNDGSGEATRPYLAVPSGTGGAVARRMIGAAPHATDTQTVLVWTNDDTDTAADGYFMLMVF